MRPGFIEAARNLDDAIERARHWEQVLAAADKEQKTGRGHYKIVIHRLWNGNYPTFGVYAEEK